MEFIIMGILLAIIIIAYAEISKKQKAKEVGAIEKISIGKYLIGLPKTNNSANDVSCLITEDDFIFINSFGDELGLIPRNSINQILIEDKSQISQRLTVTRMLTLGIFSLATPKRKKHKEFCIMIDWDDDSGIRHNTIFEFSGSFSNTLANDAYNKLVKHIKHKAIKLKEDEKKCPYCSEIIKKDAIICRYCGKNI